MKEGDTFISYSNNVFNQIRGNILWHPIWYISYLTDYVGFSMLEKPDTPQAKLQWPQIYSQHQLLLVTNLTFTAIPSLTRSYRVLRLVITITFSSVSSTLSLYHPMKVFLAQLFSCYVFSPPFDTSSPVLAHFTLSVLIHTSCYYLLPT